MAGLLTLVNQDEDITALQVQYHTFFFALKQPDKPFIVLTELSLLKVRNLSGEWISAPPVPGTFVCNIGDMLKVIYIFCREFFNSSFYDR